MDDHDEEEEDDEASEFSVVSNFRLVAEEEDHGRCRPGGLGTFTRDNSGTPSTEKEYLSAQNK